jgi:hypothetical protein
MTTFMRALVCLAGLLVAAGPGFGQSSLAEVRDGAELFKPDTILAVDDQLQELRRLYHHDILIETIKEVPRDERALLQKGRPPARAFAAWAQRLAEQRGVEGIYVLLSTDPRFKHASVTIWPPSMETVLSSSDGNEIRRAFVNRARTSPNQALVSMVEEIRDQLQARLGDHATTSPVTWMTIGLVVVGILVLWVVALAVRMKLDGKKPAPLAEKEGTGTLMPGVMGGLFGTVASHWIYDKTLPQPEEGEKGGKKEEEQESENRVPPSLLPSVPPLEHDQR